MNDHDQHNRPLALFMANECVKDHSEDYEDPEDKADRTLSILALMVYDMTETELREWLTLGGLTLTDYDHLTAAQEYVSWYVAAGALEITDLYSFSLVEPGSRMALLHMDDSRMQERMERIKTERIFFRDFICPNIEE